VTPAAVLPGADWLAFEGAPTPLGATLAAGGQAFNFALYSAAATSVAVHLYALADLVHPTFSLAFDPTRNKSGPVWHARVSLADAGGADYYSYSVGGLSAPGTGGRFDSEKVLLDPYANAVFFPPGFSRDVASQPGSNAGQAPLGVLPKAAAPFDWSGDAPPRHTCGAVPGAGRAPPPPHFRRGRLRDAREGVHEQPELRCRSR